MKLRIPPRSANYEGDSDAASADRTHAIRRNAASKHLRSYLDMNSMFTTLFVSDSCEDVQRNHLAEFRATTPFSHGEHEHRQTFLLARTLPTHLSPWVRPYEGSHVRVESGAECALHKRDIPSIPIGVSTSRLASVLIPCKSNPLRPHRAGSFPASAAAAAAGAGATNRCSRRISTRCSATGHRRCSEAYLGQLLSELLAQAVQHFQRRERQEVFPAPSPYVVIGAVAALCS